MQSKAFPNMEYVAIHIELVLLITTIHSYRIMIDPYMHSYIIYVRTHNPHTHTHIYIIIYIIRI